MVLCINVGKFSIKYKLFHGEEVEKSGSVDRIGHEKVFSHVQGWEKLFQSLSADEKDIDTVLFKFPSGFNKFGKIVKLNQKKFDEIVLENQNIPFVQNNVFEIASVVMNVLPNAQHFAVFDDGFFSEVSPKNLLYAISQDVCSRHNLYKHGLHGLSHQYTLRFAQKELGLIRTQRMISLHLGDNSSIAAIREGKCIDMSGGFSSLSGLIGMTSPGDIDGGLIYSLLKSEGEEQVNSIITKQSGMAGITAVSDDMRDILYLAGYKVDDEKYIPNAELPKDEQYIHNARLAIEMYIDRIVKYIGGYIAVLGGIDTLAITGTIGFSSSEIKNMILNNLGFIKDYEILVVEPNEELEMKLEFENLLSVKKKEE